MKRRFEVPCRFVRFAVLIPSIFALTGCAMDTETDAEVGDISAAISQENPDGSIAQIIARRYLADPDVTFRSFATQGIPGACSATMIGPNVAMTAAHCGFNAHTMAFMTYRLLSPSQQVIEQVSCAPLLQTFADTDLLLLYCPPINGINPGDKYGYVDFDTSAPVVGRPVYSIWKNPVDTLGENEHMLYSEGTITSTTASSWTTPDAFPNTAVLTNLWGREGASGSAQLSRTSHRLWIGPLSVAPGGDGGPQRWSLSMRDYLTRSQVSGSANVNAATVRSFNLDPAAYTGSVDKDRDMLFDVQEAVERVTGEGRRDHYAMAFFSERQNALWTTFPTLSSASFQPADQAVLMQAHGGVGYKEALRHERLNLRAGANYRVSIMVYGNATTANGLNVALDRDFGALGGWAPVDSRDISVTANGQWVMHSFNLRTWSTGKHALTIRKLPQTDVWISSVNLIEENSLLDFDTHDKRIHFRNDNNGARAFIVPDGLGTGADWAAVVRRTDSLANGNDWPLRNRQTALVANRTYSVCFQMRKYLGHPDAPITGYVRVKSGNTVVASRTFAVPSTNWTQVCLPQFSPTTGDNNLQFGIYAPLLSGGSPSGAAYLVDDIAIRAL